jgi:hypothetical protein
VLRCRDEVDLGPLKTALRDTRLLPLLLAVCPACALEEVDVRDGAAQMIPGQPGGLDLYVADYEGVCDDLKGPGLRAGARLIHLVLPAPNGAPPEEDFSIPPTTAFFDPVQPPPRPLSAETTEVAGTLRITERTPVVIGALDVNASYQTGGKVHFVGEFVVSYCVYPLRGGP